MSAGSASERVSSKTVGSASTRSAACGVTWKTPSLHPASTPASVTSSVQQLGGDARHAGEAQRPSARRGGVDAPGGGHVELLARAHDGLHRALEAQALVEGAQPRGQFQARDAVVAGRPEPALAVAEEAQDHVVDQPHRLVLDAEQGPRRIEDEQALAQGGQGQIAVGQDQRL